MPKFLFFGELDKMVNLEVGKKFSNLLENSKTHVINGCGHMIMIEKAFEMREKILKFLNSWKIIQSQNQEGSEALLIPQG